MTIMKTSRGYAIFSKTGKALTKTNLTREEVEKRWNQLQWFRKPYEYKPQGSEENS